MKLDPAGKLIDSTYFHGSQGGSNWIAALAVDALGNAYFTGGKKPAPFSPQIRPARSRPSRAASE